MLGFHLRAKGTFGSYKPGDVIGDEAAIKSVLASHPGYVVRVAGDVLPASAATPAPASVSAPVAAPLPAERIDWSPAQGEQKPV